ncbi:transporter substrate-binding domain-containing protein [Paucibacter sp. R3-3]|uniref:Transporter substrate-binding domain-containing protein n=1 Tax=Roseateles agri TaxID=3098619 RepID=A0ABU5DHN7_9BURK|nr:transporter substrate-binding domain-containing protein [Paucibacter sp. R3-3]MDY0745807.1 transporter substrate-binding domain-containing protein [Paucibacter sp. R3-3]
MPTLPKLTAPVDLGRRLAVFWLGALGAMGTRSAFAATEPRVLRALVESWPPYVYPGKGNEVRGLDAELLQAICQQAGFKLVWVRTPQARRRRRFQELLDDRFDVVFSATPIARDIDSVQYTRPYRQEVMMVAAPAVHDAALDELRSFEDVLDRRVRLLCPDVGGLGKEFEASRAQLESAGLLVRYPTTRQGIDMLRAERAQLIIGDSRDLQEQSRLLAFPLVQQPYGLSAEPVSLMLSRRRLNAADVEAIDQAIEELERRGVLRAIRDRYALVPPGTVPATPP